MFNKKKLLTVKKEKSLVSLRYGAKNTNLCIYTAMTELDPNGAKYLNSVRGVSMDYMFARCASFCQGTVTSK